MSKIGLQFPSCSETGQGKLFMGQMTVMATNGHASFIVTNSTTAEQNAFILWHGTPTAAEDWTAEITGHNSAFHPSCQLQLAVLNTEAWNSGAVEGFVVSMMNKLSVGTFGTSWWHDPDWTPRVRLGTTSTDFKLRLVYHSTSQTIEAWYHPTVSGQGWTQLDSMTLNDMSPGMTATNTFSLAILANTDYGPIAEGEIWADNYSLVRPAQAPLQFCCLSVSNGILQMRLDGLPGAIVVVDTSLDLATWTPWQTNTLPAGGLPLVMSMGTSRQFFRARIP